MAAVRSARPVSAEVGERVPVTAQEAQHLTAGPHHDPAVEDGIAEIPGNVGGESRGERPGPRHREAREQERHEPRVVQGRPQAVHQRMGPPGGFHQA